MSVAVAQEKPGTSPATAAIQKAETAVKAIVEVPDGKRSFDNTVGALDDLLVRLENDTQMPIFMAQVSINADERERGRALEEEINNWKIGLTKREDLYKAFKTFAATEPKLEGEQKRLLAFSLRDFRRAGMELPADKRERLKAIELEINKLGIEFEKNIATDATSVPFLPEELKGVPEDILKQQERSVGLYLLKMDNPTYTAVLDYCDNETTRHKMYVEYKRRGGKTNVALLEKILKLRAEAAQLLGYANPAEFETEIRMAKNAVVVKRFYDELAPLVRKKGVADLEEFAAAKRMHTGRWDAQLYPWDLTFYKNRLLKEKYAVDSEKVREYFPLQSVIDGLFAVTQSLYGLEYRDVTAKAAEKGWPLWHPDVKLYEVWDKADKRLIGEFYLDLFPRDDKYGHAAEFGLRSRKIWPDGTVQTPRCALVCNFTKPTPDKPSLLTHDEVETFFHEFGHCLHALLSDTKYGQFSGTSVALDFVEAPSQMFENWVWDKAVLKSFAKHYKTNEPFPDVLLDGMVKAKHLASGLETLQQLYYGTTDQRYHTAPEGKVDTTKVALDTYVDVHVFGPAVEGTYYQAGFGHLVGYQAGYYSYLWSLVFAQDMFTRFKEKGLLTPEAGMYYRKKILSRGGTVDEMDMLKDYLGREPKMDAFLEHLGLKEEKKTQ